MEFLQQLINGLSLGSVYALIAIGYTMVYGIIKLINFAHGDIYMIGAFVAYYCVTILHLSFFPTLIISMGASALLGIIIERLAYKPLRNAPKIALFITAIGVSLFLENTMRLNILAGPDVKPFPQMIKVDKVIDTPNFQITNLQIIAFLVVIALVILLQLIVYRTKVGKAMRATSYDMEAAQLMGINVNNVISVTFAIGSALAAAAGVLVGLLYPSINPYMGILPGLKAFCAAVLGGIGILPGAMLGGIIIGLAETFTKAVGFSNYADAIAFAILILILLVRPAGLLGKKANEKV